MVEKTNLVDEAVKQSGEVLGKAYDDLVHPTAESVGVSISLLPRTIRVWFGKWEKLVINGEESIKLAAKAVKEKADKIPEEKLTEPEPYVAVPAIQQLSYCYDSKELREMYANLLVASMNIDTKYSVHPSYVDIIKQLTPDEAKLLKIISVFPLNNPYPIVSVRLYLSNQCSNYLIILRNFSNMGDDICDNPNSISSYLDNFLRLGIIEIPPNTCVASDDVYGPIEKHPAVLKLMEQHLNDGCRREIRRGGFWLTEFGKNFIKTCVS